MDDTPKSSGPCPTHRRPHLQHSLAPLIAIQFRPRAAKLCIWVTWVRVGSTARYRSNDTTRHAVADGCDDASATIAMNRPFSTLAAVSPWQETEEQFLDTIELRWPMRPEHTPKSPLSVTEHSNVTDRTGTGWNTDCPPLPHRCWRSQEIERLRWIVTGG